MISKTFCQWFVSLQMPFSTTFWSWPSNLELLSLKELMSIIFLLWLQAMPRGMACFCFNCIRKEKPPVSIYSELDHLFSRSKKRWWLKAITVPKTLLWILVISSPNRRNKDAITRTYSPALICISSCKTSLNLECFCHAKSDNWYYSWLYVQEYKQVSLFPSLSRSLSHRHTYTHKGRWQCIAVLQLGIQ